MVSEKGFTDWLDEELARRNWRPADLARAAGISSATISHLYSGARKPGPEVAVAIAKGLNLPPEYVFRQAGLLPPRTEVEEDLSFQQILAIMQDMTEEERKEIVDYALFRLRRGQEDS